MKNLRVATLVLLLPLLLGTAGVAAIQWKTTHIERELPVGETLISAVFSFENTGPRPTRIIDVQTNCGCTGGNHTREVVERGKRGEVTLVFNASGRRGLQQNRAVVELDVGGRREQQTLQFTVSIPQLITLTPQVVQWPASAESRPERRVRVRLDPRFDPKISKIEYDDTIFAVRQVVDPENPEYLDLYIQPSVDGDLPPDRHQIIVTAKTGDDREQKASIFVLIR